jgi:hypothetical protein
MTKGTSNGTTGIYTCKFGPCGQIYEHVGIALAIVYGFALISNCVVFT